LIDLVEPDATFSAGDYASMAWEQLGQTRGVFVGGTGFYLRATAWTRSEGDASEPASPRRAAFEATWAAREEGDPGAAHRALSALDPTTAHRIHPHNLVRVVRALWLCHAQGRPISEVRREHPPRPRLHLMLLVVDPGARTLDETIASRIDAMLDRGWLAEVERLAASGYDARYKSMRSLGYKQLLDVVEGRSDLPSAREAIVAATRHYARRQRTYIRHQFPGALRVDLSDATQCPWDDVLAFARGKGSP
jgi:tRNA dimethylallyltransferase